MKNKKAIAVFLGITLILSCICYYLRINGGDAAAGMTSVLMFCPAIAAFIVHMLFNRKENIIGWNKCRLRYIIAAIFIPFIYLGVSYGIYLLIDNNAFTGQVHTSNIGMLLLSIPSSLLLAAGEEIGWRGFLLPKLTEVLNAKSAVLISGLIWAVWHFPLMIAGLYQTGTPIWYQLPMFTIGVMAITILISYLRLSSKSVFPAIVFHASHNYFDQVIFGPMTSGNKSAFIVGETGCITVALVAAIAVIVVRKTNACCNL